MGAELSWITTIRPITLTIEELGGVLVSSLEFLESEVVNVEEIVAALIKAHTNGDSFLLLTFAEVTLEDGRRSVEVNCHFDQPLTKAVAAQFLEMEAEGDVYTPHSLAPKGDGGTFH
jgi:hypothetical protein